jgi:hypothetical protein
MSKRKILQDLLQSKLYIRTVDIDQENVMRVSKSINWKYNGSKLTTIRECVKKVVDLNGRIVYSEDKVTFSNENHLKVNLALVYI